MNCCGGLFVTCFVTLLLFLAVECTELTFELEDNARQCFYEEIQKEVKGSLEFQVGARLPNFYRCGQLFCVDGKIELSNQTNLIQFMLVLVS